MHKLWKATMECSPLMCSDALKVKYKRRPGYRVELSACFYVPRDLYGPYCTTILFDEKLLIVSDQAQFITSLPVLIRHVFHIVHHSLCLVRQLEFIHGTLWLRATHENHLVDASIYGIHDRRSRYRFRIRRSEWLHLTRRVWPLPTPLLTHPPSLFPPTTSKRKKWWTLPRFLPYELQTND